MSEQEDQRLAEVRRIVEESAARVGVLARCRIPRRDSDVAMVFLRGPRDAVLNLPVSLLDDLRDYDLEIVRSSSSREGRYLLVLAVTEPLGDQDTQMPERRAKLRRRLRREGAKA